MGGDWGLQLRSRRQSVRHSGNRSWRRGSGKNALNKIGFGLGERSRSKSDWNVNGGRGIQ